MFVIEGKGWGQRGSWGSGAGHEDGGVQRRDHFHKNNHGDDRQAGSPEPNAWTNRTRSSLSGQQHHEDGGDETRMSRQSNPAGNWSQHHNGPAATPIPDGPGVYDIAFILQNFRPFKAQNETMERKQVYSEVAFSPELALSPPQDFMEGLFV